MLDAAGDWTASDPFDATVYTDSTVFSGDAGFDSFQGLIFTESTSTMMHLRITGTATSGMVLTKNAGQSALNGRWVVGDRKWRGETPSRGVSIVVEHNDVLYLHHAYDYPQVGLERTFRATLSGDTYVDNAQGWSGKLSSGGNRIIGEWIGWDGWYHSLDKAETPASGALNGDWHSISLDWAHHTATGDIIRAYGSATITQNGDSLSIVDTYDDGTTYMVEANWQGDHYEGSWWDAAAPGSTSSWRGELLAGGWYLHGTWSSGEYSFAAFPLMDAAHVATEVADSSAMIIDPYEDTVAVVHDSSRGVAANVYRDQDRVSGFSFVNASGEVRMTIDERFRPTEIVTDTETVTYNWSSDSTSVEITVDQGGSTTTATVSVDLSDAGLIALASTAGSQTGQDVTFLIEWINNNPGQIAAIAQGTEAPPDLDPTLPAPVSAKGIVGHSVKQVGVGGDPLATAITTASILSTLLSFAASSLAATATTAAVIVGVAAVAAGLVAFGLLLSYFLFMLIEGCDPCNLGCFINCIDVPQNP
jgi:hypothetical protein